MIINQRSTDYIQKEKTQYCISFLIFLLFSFSLNFIKTFNPLIKLEENITRFSNISYQFIEPIMKPDEKNIFYKYLDKAKIFFEFGSGGSTHQAALRCMTIYTVECGPEWHNLIKRDFKYAQQSNPQFQPNINYITYNFSTKLNPSTEEHQNYASSYKKEYNADLIFINGKFKQSCLIDIYTKITEKTIVITYDIDLLNNKNYYTIIDKSGKILVLKKTDSSSENNIKLRIRDQYDRNSNGMHQLLRNYQQIVDKYKDQEDNCIKPTSPIIWTLWWDGEANAPEIVRLCIQSIRDHFKFGKVLCLSKENYTNYTTIPSYIVDKMNEKKMSLTHFSDVLRVNLLMNQGGMWLDSTIFCHEDIEQAWFEKKFYTVHRENNFPIGGGKWTVFDISGYKNSIMYQFINDLFNAFWLDHDRIPHYFMFDSFFLFGYTYIPIIRRYIDDVPLTINYVSELFYSLKNKYDKDEFDKITKFSFFSKLSYKHQLFDEISGKQTMYGFLKSIQNFSK